MSVYLAIMQYVCIAFIFNFTESYSIILLGIFLLYWLMDNTIYSYRRVVGFYFVSHSLWLQYIQLQYSLPATKTFQYGYNNYTGNTCVHTSLIALGIGVGAAGNTTSTTVVSSGDIPGCKRCEHVHLL